MVTKERLHQLVDSLSPEQADRAMRLLEQVQHEELATVPQTDDQPKNAGNATHEASELERRLPMPAEILQQYGPLTMVRAAPPLKNLDQFVGTIFPEDETAEEFDATIRRWRTEGGRGRLPD
jgi:hypothetical protein